MTISAPASLVEVPRLQTTPAIQQENKTFTQFYPYYWKVAAALYTPYIGESNAGSRSSSLLKSLHTNYSFASLSDFELSFFEQIKKDYVYINGDSTLIKKLEIFTQQVTDKDKDGITLQELINKANGPY